MIGLVLLLIIIFIYLAYCIIATHNVALENNAMLHKLLELEKKKQSDSVVPQPPLPSSDTELPSE